MVLLVISLVLLVVCSGFFSGAETGMMALNRYRLRHLVRKGNRNAKRVAKLLERPDRLLGVVLIGNTFTNVFASVVATLIAVQLWGERGAWLSAVILTLFILIFAETAPKTLAAVHPQAFAFFAVRVLRFLLKICYPIVWLVNGIANGLLNIFHIQVKKNRMDTLSRDELTTVVHEASATLGGHYKRIMLRALELEQMTVEDVMTPRNEICGIDLSEPWDRIVTQITSTPFLFLPVYDENISKVNGVLNMKKLIAALPQRRFEKTELLSLMDEVYFIPETTKASQQLINFQQKNKSVGLVVDEYGEIQGLVTIQDIIEEIVGEFAADEADIESLITPADGGGYYVDGSINIRELNRIMGWELPTAGPRTLSGLVIEYLETIPKQGAQLNIAHYTLGVEKISGNTIQKLRIWPPSNEYETDQQQD